jgi:CHAD domain-containing protein
MHAEARAMINSPASTLFTIRVEAFIALRGWRKALTSDLALLLRQPARPFASEALERLRNRALRRGKGLAQKSDEERHEVRIALKNLRYAAEFFGGMFADPEDVGAYVQAIARLQDLLGAHNDAANAQTFLDQLRAKERIETSFAAGIVLGWLGNGTSVAEGNLLKAWRNFKGMAPFWR